MSWSEIAFEVQGSCQTTWAIADQYDVDEDEVEEGLLEHNIEACPHCGFWVESCDILFGQNDEPVACYGCSDPDDIPY